MPANSETTRSRLSQGLSDYWNESRRPLVSLSFVLPLLAAYEGGVFLLGPRAIHNGADVWMRRQLDQFGFGHYSFLPLLTVAMLLAWHHVRRERWQVPARVLSVMCLESGLLGLALVAIAYLERSLLEWSFEPAPAAIGLQLSAPLASALGRLVGFCGAGIYEEVLFRLLAIPLVAGLLTMLGTKRPVPVVGAVVLTSLAFSGAHYMGRHGETLELFSFVFRWLAGGFFAVLFVYRGFGIAAGTHALYDIFVGFFCR